MHILIIDDSRDIAENISLFLQDKGYSTSNASDGAEAFEMIKRKKYDFLIVDRMMPEIDGLSLIRMLHSRNISIPFLFLTALGKQLDKLEGLALGADDYLVKPFDLEELALRMENIMRRNGGGSALENRDVFQFEDITMERSAHRIERSGIQIDLAPKEYELLELLVKHRGQVLSRDILYEKVWGDYDVSDKVLETINVHVAHLRKKLHPDLIRTVKLVGYIID